MGVQTPDHNHARARSSSAATSYDASFQSDQDILTSLTRLQRFAVRIHPWQFNAIAGAVGGITSGVVTCPLDVIKTKLQAQGGFANYGHGIPPDQTKVYNGLVGTARVILRNEGLRGMYRGLGPITMGYLPTWAVYFTVYQRTKTAWSQLSDNRHVVNICSSLVAGATSTMVTNPIWVIKTRLMSQSVSRLSQEDAAGVGDKTRSLSRQTPRAPWHYKSTLDAAKTMYKNEGLLSFYSGLTPALIGLSHVAIHVPTYEFLKTKLTGQGLGALPENGQDPGKTKWIGILAASILSKIFASSATYPHEVIRTRFQTQVRLTRNPDGQLPGQTTRTELKYRGVVKTYRTILREEGWRAFYAGLGTNMMRAVPAATVTFLTYEYVVAALQRAQMEGQARVKVGDMGVG